MGAGNSGLAMAAHLSYEGHSVTIWNRTSNNIRKLMKTRIIKSEGVIKGNIMVDSITDDIKQAVHDPDVILITTPASAHRDLAKEIALNINKETLVILNPGRTLGAVEFERIYSQYNNKVKQTIAETQTIIYTCRKTGEDSVNIIALKKEVLISAMKPEVNNEIINRLPECLKEYFIPAKSLVETSIGNVGMVLHCAPLMLNSGWTENENNIYRYYYDGITPTVARFIEKIDGERIEVSSRLGIRVESTIEWLRRTYKIKGNTLYECIQNNKAYRMIDAPISLNHRYILEDVPCGLVPLEALGVELGINMKFTGIIIDLAIGLMNIDFRKEGRNLLLNDEKDMHNIIVFLKGGPYNDNK